MFRARPADALGVSLLSFLRPAAALVLPVALWSALPSVRWCAAGDVELICFVAGDQPGASATRPPADDCAGLTADCVGVETAGEGVCCAAAASSGICERAAQLPCGAAFCVDGPVDAVPAAGAALEGPADSHVVATPAPADPAPARGPLLRAAPAFAAHAPPAAGIHPARAPPASV